MAMNSPVEPITTPFGFSTTAAEVLEGVDLTGKRIIVTGGSTGIGLGTTRALANAGADVTIATRNTERANNVIQELQRHPERSEGSLPNVQVLPLDLADLESVLTFCQSWDKPLHALINNAGIMALPTKQLSAQGYEMQFAVNHLGHFALTLGLHDALAATGHARVVSVSSQAHSLSPVDFDDIHFDHRPYDPIAAYCQSKTANSLFAIAAAKRYAPNICFNAVTPGAIPTNLQHHTGGFTVELPRELIKTPEQGAATSVLAAASPLLEGITGRYFANCNQATPTDIRLDDMTGVLPFAIDEQLAE